jgi:hypothetical protein
MELTNVNSIPFIYTVEATLAANSSRQATLIFQADSRFELMAIFASGPDTEATEVAPNNFSLLIRDQTTGRDLMSNRVPQRILCGNAFNGFLQKRGIVFEPQSNLLFDFLNLTGVEIKVTVALHGYKLIL